MLISTNKNFLINKNFIIMLQFNLEPLGKITVDFFHSPYKGQNEPRETRCEMYPVNTPGEKLIGISRCSPKDNFSRAEGRRRSFDRALELIQDRTLRMRIRREFHRVEGIPFNE